MAVVYREGTSLACDDEAETTDLKKDCMWLMGENWKIMNLAGVTR